MVMIHTGSRGLGHQVCSDYIRKMEDGFPEIVAKLPEKDLIFAPLSSQMAKDYFGAMSAAANYAWTNRHIIAHNIRKVFERVFDDVEINTIYDVAHNIAKKEIHDGKELVVHRKGATRAFPAGHKENPAHYLETGHPVLIGGSMGTASYVLVGTEKAMTETFGSTAHGAGRVMSRRTAKQSIDGLKVKAELNARNIIIKNPNPSAISDESPQVYKDVDEVIRVTVDAGICKKVARLMPIGVILG